MSISAVAHASCPHLRRQQYHFKVKHITSAMKNMSEMECYLNTSSLEWGISLK